jgi:hypothetical protein
MLRMSMRGIQKQKHHQKFSGSTDSSWERGLRQVSFCLKTQKDTANKILTRISSRVIGETKKKALQEIFRKGVNREFNHKSDKKDGKRSRKTQLF